MVGNSASSDAFIRFVTLITIICLSIAVFTESSNFMCYVKLEPQKETRILMLVVIHKRFVLIFSDHIDSMLSLNTSTCCMYDEMKFSRC